MSNHSTSVSGHPTRGDNRFFTLGCATVFLLPILATIPGDCTDSNLAPNPAYRTVMYGLSGVSHNGFFLGLALIFKAR